MAKNINCNKVKFWTSKDAYRELKKIKKNNPNRTTPRTVYLCECGSYHLTRNKNNRYLARKHKELLSIQLKSSLSSDLTIIKNNISHSRQRKIQEIKNKYNLN